MATNNDDHHIYYSLIKSWFRSKNYWSMRNWILWMCPNCPSPRKAKTDFICVGEIVKVSNAKWLGLKPNAFAIIALKNTNIWTRRGKSLIAKFQNANAGASTISLLMAHMISNAFASIPTRNTIASVANARNRNARIAQGLWAHGPAPAGQNSSITPRLLKPTNKESRKERR